MQNPIVILYTNNMEDVWIINYPLNPISVG
jgi:hypothetical protein